ncbi:HlyD family efflux transporter periplasmic adaptor subunit [Thetidibacter halocola]|uniref:HlyD family efflux transporter periplasmic adaptor subunit n=1 Tax=Thetidibacter halocola TaxID=2827239 RepID=A0A8J7WHE0_9RHOB|nr:HlyD family efflux transporter periplasmic adaptor subunit [Thetidibacter halocola]MBS0125366.1 HlyD family efflux transporter periplasmic adaptor subunit [Thetidibacter halocola]
MIKRKLRLAVGLLVLSGAAITTAPHVLNTISESAVINAPVLSVKAPFDGVLIAGDRRRGDPIAPGQTMVSIAASRIQRAELERLKAREATLTEHVLALSAEILRLEALDVSLADRSEQIRRIAFDVLVLERDALLGRVGAADRRAANLAAEADRFERLEQVGAVAGNRAGDIRTEAAIAADERRALGAELARAERQIRAVEGGALPAFGSEDGAYAQQRRDEVAIRLADLQTRRAIAAAEQRSTGAELAALGAMLTEEERFAPVAEAGGLAWTPSPSANSPVASGDEIMQVLDCSRRFLEVQIPESHFEHVHPGDTAQVRLKGAQTVFPAEVEAVLGAGALTETGRLAAQPPRTEIGRLTVVLRLPPADVTDPVIAGRFCNVGRTAQVRFEREGAMSVARRIREWVAPMELALTELLERP